MPMASIKLTGWVKLRPLFVSYRPLIEFQRQAIQGALLEASRRTDLITQCDQVLSFADGSIIQQEDR